MKLRDYLNGLRKDKAYELYGCTPNEYAKHVEEKNRMEAAKEKVKQDAHLSEQDGDLFYKLYFGLLD